MKAPVCPERYQELIVHGHRRVDPYYWLRERENQEVIDYLEQENAYFEAEMKGLESLKEEIYEEIVKRINKNESSVPYLLGGYFHYVRYQEGGEYGIYARKKGSLDAPEEVLLDHNELAAGKSYSAIGKVSVSPDDTLLVYTEDEVSRRVYTLNLMDRTSGQILEKIEGVAPGFQWSTDGAFLFYVKKDLQTLRPFQVFRKSIKGGKAREELLFEETDEGFYLSISKTKSKAYLLIESESYDSSETSLLDLENPKSKPIVFLPRAAGHEYNVDHRPGEFVIRSNESAPNFQLWRCPAENWSKANWQLIQAHHKQVLIQNFELYRDRVIVEERKDGLVSFLCKCDDGTSFYLPMPPGSYTAYTSVNVELDSSHFRYGYTSLVTPASIIDYQFESGERIVQKTQEVIGGYEENHYCSTRILVPTADGQSIPVSMVYHKDYFTAGKSPVLLYGYGSYGVVVDPAFSPARLSLLDRGFAFSIAHIRGGEYLGRPWYEDGKLLKKRNTFDDFIAVGRHLVENGLAARNNLHAMGGSAGGMLMGTVINEAPELWRSVVAAVPFVDVVTTMLDESIPLTVGEYVEWGNPNEKEYYEYMLSYSPYDNVKAQDYPAILVTTGLHDSQVQYWEPAKWVAKLRKLMTDQHRLLMWCNMETGHGGASGRYEYYKEIAMEYAFLLREAGLILD